MKLFGLFKKNQTPNNELTLISRTQTVEGLSIPGIIRNLNYHFVNLQVYKDGLVYCWEMVDLPLFRKKIDINWVVTHIPDGESISIYSLGYWKIDKGNWLYNRETFYEYVYSLVKRLNPRQENLYNCHGRTSEKIGNVEVSTFGIPNAKPYYISGNKGVFAEKTSGESFNIFFRDDDNKIYLAALSIFKDGHVELNCIPTKKSFEFTDIKTLIHNKTLLTEPLVGERINILGLGSFVLSAGSGINIEHKYNEFLDEYNVIQGHESSIQKCKHLFNLYKQQPTEELKTELQTAYEAIPLHQRIFVGDMDTKDYEVRLAIYGDKVKKEWEDAYGFEYPF